MLNLMLSCVKRGGVAAFGLLLFALAAGWGGQALVFAQAAAAETVAAPTVAPVAEAVQAQPARSAEIMALRRQYVEEVQMLAGKAEVMRLAGASEEDVARTLHADRRTLGVKYKNLTPPRELEEIYARNEKKYGDKLGPTVEWLRERGKSWRDIISSASRAGGKDLGL